MTLIIPKLVVLWLLFCVGYGGRWHYRHETLHEAPKCSFLFGAVLGLIYGCVSACLIAAVGFGLWALFFWWTP